VTTVVATLSAAVLAFTGAGTASAATAASTDYVALGDSYASGVGAGAYYDTSGSCKRSRNAFSETWALLNSPATYAFTACSGAVTTDVTNNQLGPVNSSTDLISISIGGNDTGFADVMTTCVLYSESTCLSRVQEARTYISNTLPSRLNATYTAIRNKAPNAKVVVMGYPRLYKLSGTCIAGLSETERSALNNASDAMNSVISGRASAYGFSFGDVRTTFTGHEICSGEEWIHSVTLPIENSYHPKSSGQTFGYYPVFEGIA
jgi:lysophospholipase L1-like esterase